MSKNKFAGFSLEGAEVSKKKEKKELKFFTVGIHAVTITAVEEKGTVSTDDTWERLNLTLEAGSKKTYVSLCYPTQSLMFKGEANTIMARQVLAFGQALGIDMSLNNVVAGLSKMFLNPQNLVGRELNVRFGYRRENLRPSKNGGFDLYDAKGNPIEGKNFETRDDAEAWAIEHEVKLQAFPEVVEYIAAETLTPAVLTTAKPAPTKRAF